jgi:DNA-binding MarR family transcriptional regulator
VRIDADPGPRSAVELDDRLDCRARTVKVAAQIQLIAAAGEIGRSDLVRAVVRRLAERALAAQRRRAEYIQPMARKKSASPAERIMAECNCLPLRMVHRIVTGMYDDALRSYDLRVSQLNIMVAIAMMGDAATAAQVSRYLLLEKSTLSRDLERMAERGWIGVDTRGGARTLRLTAEGQRLLDRALPAWEKAQKDSEALLGKSVAQALRAAATRMRTQLQSPE